MDVQQGLKPLIWHIIFNDTKCNSDRTFEESLGTSTRLCHFALPDLTGICEDSSKMQTVYSDDIRWSDPTEILKLTGAEQAFPEHTIV